MGCTTVITREYGARQFSTPAVMQNMTQDRAIALVYGYCLVQVKSRIASIDMESEKLEGSGHDLRVDSSGLSYTFSKLGRAVSSFSSRPIGSLSTVRTSLHPVVPVMVRVNFADVKRIEYDNWEYRINLYDGNGHRLFRFYHVGYNCKYTPSFACGKDKKEELMAGLLILCPNVP